tara:strand:+ start:60 stop:221 length:162 start_codon:yes stop_codon:yes gene_type:complete
MPIEVGCLVRNITTVDNPVVWLVLDEIADSVLIVSQITNYKMWAEKSHFEVVA